MNKKLLLMVILILILSSFLYSIDLSTGDESAELIFRRNGKMGNYVIDINQNVRIVLEGKDYIKLRLNPGEYLLFFELEMRIGDTPTPNATSKFLYLNLKDGDFYDYTLSSFYDGVVFFTSEDEFDPANYIETENIYTIGELRYETLP